MWKTSQKKKKRVHFKENVNLSSKDVYSSGWFWIIKQRFHLQKIFVILSMRLGCTQGYVINLILKGTLFAVIMSKENYTVQKLWF